MRSLDVLSHRYSLCRQRSIAAIALSLAEHFHKQAAARTRKMPQTQKGIEWHTGHWPRPVGIWCRGRLVCCSRIMLCMSPVPQQRMMAQLESLCEAQVPPADTAPALSAEQEGRASVGARRMCKVDPRELEAPSVLWLLRTWFVVPLVLPPCPPLPSSLPLPPCI